ncbi:MAG: cation-translocating P-type ATPase [Candidatus Falkowbacteria bacterium]
MKITSTFQFDYQKIKGLSRQEAAIRLDKEGLNQLTIKKRNGLFKILIEILSEPMFFLLLICSGLYFWLGERNEAIALLLSVLLIILIELYQENKTERALESLKDLSSPRALVIRSGESVRIAGKEVVRGDVVVLSEGDRVPADAVLIFSVNLQVDESILTGESMPVNKMARESAEEIELPGVENSHSVYASTLVVAGHGVARVVSIGQNTEVGKIGKSLNALKPEKTKLQAEVDSLVKTLAIYGAVICLAVALIYGLTRDSWLNGFLAGISLAMSILPEEFPVIFTVFMALGAWRLSRFNVLTSQQKTIQSLGSITVLCVDKTGTLTENKMELEALDIGSEVWLKNNQLPSKSYFELVDLSVLASQNIPFDPLEIALKQSHASIHLNQIDQTLDWELIQEYPLSRQLLAVSHVWRIPHKQEYLIATKGAPEAIIELCHLSKKDEKYWLRKVTELAKLGLRVLAVAKAESAHIELPNSPHDFNFIFMGLLGFGDPVRSGVPESVSECHRAGIKVVMITGDYPETAAKIGQEIGLPKDARIITGVELAKMSDDDLKAAVNNVCIFARINPEQKLKIVQAYKANGQIVAMTGDGVNDAPALKAAQAGIAMGKRGTDVAREAAGIVLLDDNFNSIISGIRQGRKIFDNIRKASYYVMAIHISVAGITFLSVIVGWPLMLLPVHLAFLELIIDPACSIAFENEPAERDVMKRPPRNPELKIFTWSLFRMAIFQGLSVLIGLAAIFKLGDILSLPIEQIRAMVFTTLIIANLFLILTNRSWTRNVWQSFKQKNNFLWFVILFSFTFLGASLFLPWLSQLFHLIRPDAWLLFISGFVGVFCVMILERFEQNINTEN